MAEHPSSSPPPLSSLLYLSSPAPSGAMPCPPSTVSERIPLPPQGRKRSFLEFIREADRPDYYRAKELITRLLPEELNVQCTWNKQNDGATQRLIEKVLETYPVFAEYEDAWPVAYYCIQRLSYLRRPIDKTAQLLTFRSPGRATASPSSMSLSAGDVEHGPRRSSRISQRRNEETEGITRNSPAGPHQCSQISRDTPETNLCFDDVPSSSAHNDAPSSSAHNDAPSSSANNDASSGSANIKPAGEARPPVGISHDLTQGEQEVLRFLLAIDGTFGYLLDRFRVAGMTSKARLLTVARWSNAEKEGFLGEIRMDIFERKMLSEGLAKLAANSA